MRLIKLTDTDGYTRRGKPDETYWLADPPSPLPGGELCEPGVYHAYPSPETAALMDPIHGDYLAQGGRAHWAEGEVCVRDATKIGCRSLRVVSPCELPRLSTAVRVRTAIYCAQAITPRGTVPEWDLWADRWLSGEDRSARAASAARAAWAAAGAAAAEAAAWAAEAAARAGAHQLTEGIDLTEIVHRALRDEP